MNNSNSFFGRIPIRTDITVLSGNCKYLYWQASPDRTKVSASYLTTTDKYEVSTLFPNTATISITKDSLNLINGTIENMAMGILRAIRNNSQNIQNFHNFIIDKEALGLMWYGEEVPEDFKRLKEYFDRIKNLELYL